MRVIDFNGYIESMQWYDDDITPEMLRRELYGEAGGNADDVTLRMNCYGGDTNAATQMHDMLKEYPGHVTVRISGTAASAATVVACGADRVEMTPGSLYMIHDPMTFTFGNIADHKAGLKLLDTVKASIINIYEARNGMSREKLSAMMTATTWMDAKEALAKGFVDPVISGSVTDAAVPRAHVTETLDSARKKVEAYAERVKMRMCAQVLGGMNGGTITERAMRTMLDISCGGVIEASPITACSLPAAAIVADSMAADIITAEALSKSNVTHDAGENAPAVKTGDDARDDVPAGTSAELLRRRLKLYE